MHKGKFLIGAAVLTVAVAGLANAGPDRRGHFGAPGMMGMGPDDLPMSVQALKERQAGRFSEADVNGDGRLDADEMQALMMRMRAERRIQRLDSDGDGAVSQEEFAYPMERRLMRMDRNGDGRIDETEAASGRRGWHGDHDRRGDCRDDDRRPRRGDSRWDDDRD
ncbi:hypothetical protein KBTX_04133 [wastewater metagenome]|uniref:EF-hand domain-containing protein n=2 Tax=unclassified sequences TaxID=12908 RepID=A0A5B8RFX4_9ZZZZ|nr:EF-hand domain-containing protein [Arhodomonas sp. KWT]QEA07770.1 hypothetical protein KBTEX_04133 [uncultured organism]